VAVDDSVTNWCLALQAGDQAGAERLWQRYYQAMVQVARSRLSGAPKLAADEEDVALSAFDSFCRGVEAGRFPRLTDRDGLWRLLVVITARKAINQADKELRRARRLPQAKSGKNAATNPVDIAEVVCDEPTPEFCAQTAENLRELLASLGDKQLQELAVSKMEGYANEEIAARLGCSLRTVERKLGIIRREWSHLAGA
jgi:DNA-directed RNA polymerase specialized sigma24 family protein